MVSPTSSNKITWISVAVHTFPLAVLTFHFVFDVTRTPYNPLSPKHEMLSYRRERVSTTLPTIPLTTAGGTSWRESHQFTSTKTKRACMENHPTPSLASSLSSSPMKRRNSMTAGTRQTRSMTSNSARDLGWTGFMTSVDARASSSRWRTFPPNKQKTKDNRAKKRRGAASVRVVAGPPCGLKGTRLASSGLHTFPTPSRLQQPSAQFLWMKCPVLRQHFFLSKKKARLEAWKRDMHEFGGRGVGWCWRESGQNACSLFSFSSAVGSGKRYQEVPQNPVTWARGV